MPGEKILIVDDDNDVVFSIASLLEYKGYKVAMVQDGAQALQKVREDRPDLIVLDVMMPVMNGYEVCYALKNDKSTSDIPIIILTARHTGNEAEEAVTVKADWYIGKPFDNLNLIERIEHFIAEKQNKRTK